MIRLIFVGKVKDTWIKEAIDEYVKRLGRWTKVELIEIKDERIIGKDANKIIEAEADRILPLLKDEYIIALDVAGKELKSGQFADTIKQATLDNPKITFIIGGALGISPRLLKKAKLKLSMSKMTLTHQMIRILLVEQIYRAYTIMKGIDYHK